MYLYPYKIFSLSKNKRLCKREEKNTNKLIPVGIYDAELNSYAECAKNAEAMDAQVSVMLGQVCGDINLICLDLDDCFDDKGILSEDTKEFLKRFNETEYEVSSSGEGIHIYILTKLKLDTFIVKNMEGCKSFECYTNKRHIVTTYFDFESTDLKVGKHDEFIKAMYDKVNKQRNTQIVQDVKTIFKGTEINNDIDIRAAYYKRTPVTNMYTLRGLGYKDPGIIEVIDTVPETVDQSAHDAKLIRKLMYYTLDLEAAWDLAEKTNYFKAKDERHKKKFKSPEYRQRTNKLLMR